MGEICSRTDGWGSNFLLVPAWILPRSEETAAVAVPRFALPNKFVSEKVSSCGFDFSLRTIRDGRFVGCGSAPLKGVRSLPGREEEANHDANGDGDDKGWKASTPGDGRLNHRDERAIHFIMEWRAFSDTRSCN